jgi:hypothetical protein
MDVRLNASSRRDSTLRYAATLHVTQTLLRKMPDRMADLLEQCVTLATSQISHLVPQHVDAARRLGSWGL